ncbi:MAG: HAD family phosphatase [Phycisphaeraceae bacterium]
MLKAIIFDFDGVLCDSEPLHYQAFLRVACDFGRTFTYPQYVERYIGYDDRDAFGAMLEEAGRFDEAHNGEHIARLVAQKGDAFEAVVREGVQTFPGTQQFVERVARQVPVAIASGATRRDIDLILRSLDFAATFAPIITADQVQRSKPDPQTYALAAARMAELHPQLHLAPANCLAIEDTPAGIESARAAGLMTLGITTTGTAAALHRAGRVIPSLGGVTFEQLRKWY